MYLNITHCTLSKIRNQVNLLLENTLHRTDINFKWSIDKTNLNK